MSTIEELIVTNVRLRSQSQQPSVTGAAALPRKQSYECSEKGP